MILSLKRLYSFVLRFFADMANTPIRLIVGLGNPGPEYERTRHNAGFRFLDALADKNGGTFRNEPKFKGEIARARIAGEEVWLLKPLTS